jgi:Sec-independent protein translocase protein TatA
VHDVLAMRLNRVDIKGDARAGEMGKKSYDLEAADDAFWSANADAQFPVVAEEVEKALGEYKKAMADITSATSGTGTKEGAGEGNTNSARNEESRNDTSALVSAVASLPQLQERKRVIDKHTNIATALLGEIKQRGLDEYHVVEEDLLAGKPDRAAMMGLLDATGRGTPEDKLRLAIVRAAAAARQRARDGTDAEDAET